MDHLSFCSSCFIHVSYILIYVVNSMLLESRFHVVYVPSTLIPWSVFLLMFPRYDFPQVCIEIPATQAEPLPCLCGLEETFDRAWHAALWATRLYNIHANLIKTIECLYKATSEVCCDNNIYCAQKETHIFMSLILCNIWSFEIYKIKTVRKKSAIMSRQ